MTVVATVEAEAAGETGAASVGTATKGTAHGQ